MGLEVLEVYPDSPPGREWVLLLLGFMAAISWGMKVRVRMVFNIVKVVAVLLRGRGGDSKDLLR